MWRGKKTEKDLLLLALEHLYGQKGGR